jgi:Phage major capsid protein E
MKNMSTSQARVVDPILSNHAQGYTNMELIGSILFPKVTVPARGGTVLKFGKEGFRRFNARRAPGANTLRVQYGYASSPISVVQESLEAVVPFEIMQEAEKVPGVDMAKGSVDMVLDSIGLNLEYDQAQLAKNADNYGVNNKLTLTGADKWSDDASDPQADVKEAKESIRLMIGRYPNTLCLGADVFNRLTVHPKVKEHFKYTSADSVTEDMLARYLEIEKIVVGKAVSLAEDAPDTDPAEDLWAGTAILAWASRGNNYRTPSYGYTYELPGMPYVEEPYSDRSAKSWIYPVTHERQPYLVGADAGFLFQTPL